MPFIGIQDGEQVFPPQVDADAKPVCPDCGTKMHYRRKHRTKNGVFKPACFVHESKQTGYCAESDEHKLMKYVAARNLAHLYDHAEIQKEVQVPGTSRVADVIAEFPASQIPLGNGVIAEVQYKNKDKDVPKVTEEYHDAGYSVYWVFQHHFSDGFSKLSLPNVMRPWPQAVPDVSEWTGLEPPFYKVRNLKPERRPMEVRMPAEYLERHRDSLEAHHALGAGRFEPDLVYPLADGNAPRRCEVCGEDASWYVFDDGILSTFRCVDHIGELSISDRESTEGAEA